MGGVCRSTWRVPSAPDGRLVGLGVFGDGLGVFGEGSGVGLGWGSLGGGSWVGVGLVDFGVWLGVFWGGSSVGVGLGVFGDGLGSLGLDRWSFGGGDWTPQTPVVVGGFGV